MDAVCAMNPAMRAAMVDGSAGVDVAVIPSVRTCRNIAATGTGGRTVVDVVSFSLSTPPVCRC
jgi:precorrin-3B methylase